MTTLSEIQSLSEQVGDGANFEAVFAVIHWLLDNALCDADGAPIEGVTDEEVRRIPVATCIAVTQEFFASIGVEVQDLGNGEEAEAT